MNIPKINDKRTYTFNQLLCKECGIWIDEGTGLCSFGCKYDGEVACRERPILKCVVKRVDEIVEIVE